MRGLFYCATMVAMFAGSQYLLKEDKANLKYNIYEQQ